MSRVGALSWGSRCINVLIHIRYTMFRAKRRDKTRQDETIQNETRRDVKEKEGERTRIAGGVLLGY